jgi:hypothetical protein
MPIRILPSAAVLSSVFLSACASPYFVHDPRTLVVDRAEVPRLLKSLRCELATYIAANNQRNILFAAEAKAHGLESAEEKYQYFEIDPRRFGGVSLTLQIQDNLGLQMPGVGFGGTQFNRVWTNDGGVHSHFLNLGPSGSSLSTYLANWTFVIPQDAITLRPARTNISATNQSATNALTFPCYAAVPKRASPPFDSVYAEVDLDALARNDFPDYALFKRIWVNNTTPLAAWLEDVGTSITSSTLNWHNEQQKPDRMIPAQMSYTFTIQVTGGLDVRYGLSAPLWPTVAAEVTGSMQKTNTISIFLNGIEAFDWFNVPEGNALNNEYAPLPTIKVSGPATPLPSYVGRRKPRGQPEYSPTLLSPAASVQH